MTVEFDASNHPYVPTARSPDDATARSEICPDQRAWSGRRRRLLDQVDLAMERARAHRDEHPDWSAIAAVLETLRIELDRELVNVRAGAPAWRAHPPTSSP